MTTVSLDGRHVQLAQAMAEVAHRGQRDKLGAPYIGHPLSVMARVEAELQAQGVPGMVREVRCPALIVALLHDVIEDTPVGLEELRPWFGDEVVEALDAISRRPRETYHDYIERVAANPLARRVKLCDLADNLEPRRLEQLDEPTRRRLRAKYERALEVLRPGSLGIGPAHSEAQRGGL
jgi:(p)ppGpp synthase/HD superfamily hydrolase